MVTLVTTLRGDPDPVRSSLCSATPPSAGRGRSGREGRGIMELGEEEEVGVVGKMEALDAGGGGTRGLRCACLCF